MKYFPAKIIRMNAEKLLGRAFQEKAISQKYVEVGYSRENALIEVKNPSRKSIEGSITLHINKNGNNLPYIDEKLSSFDEYAESDNEIKFILTETMRAYNCKAKQNDRS